MDTRRATNFLPSSLANGLFLPGRHATLNPTEALPFDSSLGIAIPMLMTALKASEGSVEGGRGVREEKARS